MFGSAKAMPLKSPFESVRVKLLRSPCELAKGKVSKMLSESALLVV